jgi:hypothetical protein
MNNKMWDIGKDEWDLFNVVVVLEVVSLYRDEPELETTLFNDDGETNNLTLFNLIAF